MNCSCQLHLKEKMLTVQCVILIYTVMDYKWVYEFFSKHAFCFMMHRISEKSSLSISFTVNSSSPKTKINKKEANCKEICKRYNNAGRQHYKKQLNECSFEHSNRCQLHLSSRKFFLHCSCVTLVNIIIFQIQSRKNLWCQRLPMFHSCTISHTEWVTCCDLGN